VSTPEELVGQLRALRGPYIGDGIRPAIDAREVADIIARLTADWLAHEGAIARLTAERDAALADDDLSTHKCITCGVAATHPDPTLTTRGAYAEKWNSPQAEAVRALRAERDAARAEVEALCQAVKWLLEPEPSRASRAGARRILDAARKAPATPTGSGS
jgi:hypothetical protein